MNCAERLAERIVGYPIDWDATGTWAQLVAALLALCVAYMISRVEWKAQRKVAKEKEREFAALVVGLARRAANDIDVAARALQDKSMRDLVRGGDGPRIPNTATNVMSLRQLDLNLMPSAELALAAVELRRLSGWGKTFREQAGTSWHKNGALSPEMHEALDEWSASARQALRIVEMEANKLA